MKEFLQQVGYVLEPLSNIWSRSGYGGIAYSDGDKVEQRIAAIISHAFDVTVLSTELRQHCTDWASLYHLSGTRANILRPFKNVLQGDVLEIGAGCGAITRYLGECGANVLALEGSPRRAAIARSRTRDLDNVTVLAEKFDQFQCDHQFDVITLIGVLEYANLFTTGENPALSMLKRVRSLLKPEGKLIIAIENQLGLKYFAGAPEDHLGQPIVGIEGRYRKDQPQTFGRKVLAGMLEQAGFAAQEFLAPFPDYKLPVSIITEEGFSNKKFDAAAFAWQSARRDLQLPTYCNFSLELAWPQVFQNGLGLDVTNSFLIIAAPNSQQLIATGELAYHYSVDRIPEYCKETVFTRSDGGDIRVGYRRLDTRNGNADEANGLIRFVFPDADKYVVGRPLSLEFIGIVTNDGWTFDQLARFVRRYLLIVGTFFSPANMQASMASPYAELPGEFFDVVPQNIIICEDGNASLIDKEWQLTSPIEVAHLLFRSLLLLINSITRFGLPASQAVMTRYQFIDGVFAAAGLRVQERDYIRYISLEANIQQSVTGRAAENYLTWGKDQPLPILNLSQAVVERDGQIASLSQAVTERDGQITSLSQAVTERDGQITSLSQAVTERDGQIASLSQVVTEREELIHRIIRSRSWRLTKPARFIGRLLRGDVDGSLALFRQMLAKLKNRRVDEAFVCDSNTRPVAIVLPVYKDVKMTLDCIESAMPGILDVSNAKLIIINDASPDGDMQDALKGTVERWPHAIQLLLNESNLGFVASVNKGMRIYPEHDMVLLNSDVVLPTGWLKRLRKEAYSRPNVATVTPISNNTTICTFPEFLQDNQIPFGLSVQDVDNVFSLQEMPSVEAPTGIGFCMYIRRNALNRVGYFNEERFGRGYGEENDFCQRAIKSGYVNLISPNIYVYHQGGVSFGADKEALVENAMRVIDELHPNYHADVQAFIAADPLRNARITRFVALIAAVKLPKILHVSHGIGGGVDQHIEELSEFFDERAVALLLVPDDRESFVEVRLGFRKTSDRLVFDLTQQYDELLSFLRRLSVSLVHYHHVLRLHPSLLDLPSAMSVNHVLTVHDFFLLNANPTLTDESGVFAGHYNDKFFNALYPLPDGLTPEQWRDTYRQLVETAKVVIFPSQSTMTIFENHYAVARPVVAYHPEYARNHDRPLKGIEKKNRYTVGVIGAISKEKGADLLEKIAMLAKRTRLPLDFVLIGYAYRPLRGLKTTGPYNADMLQYLLSENKIDVCFFPARWPETYSYTLSYALESGLPIIAPRLGAFPERLAGRESVLLFDHLDTPEAILSEINSFIEKLLSGVPSRCPALPVITVLTDFYSKEYLGFCTKLNDFDEKCSLNIAIRPVPLGESNRREKILSVLWKIYSHPAMRWVDSIIPFKLRRAVKRSLSRKPIHGISGR